MRLRYQLSALVILIATLCCVTASATITGTVTDTAGSSISGALITFTDESNSDLSHNAITDDNGFYTINIDQILPPYDVIISDIPNDHGYQLQISWSPSPGDVVITHYNIYRSRNQTLTDPLIISNFSSIEELIDAEENSTILIGEVSGKITRARRRLVMTLW